MNKIVADDRVGLESRSKIVRPVIKAGQINGPKKATILKEGEEIRAKRDVTGALMPPHELDVRERREERGE